jgi:phage protein D
MTERLQEELEQMDNTSFADEVAAKQEEEQPDSVEQEDVVDEPTDEAPQKEEAAKEDEVDAELEAKRKAYKERQDKRKQEEEQRRIDEENRRLEQERLRNQADTAQEQDRTKYLEQVAAKLERQEVMSAAKREYATLEKDFVEAYPDYTDKVNVAVEFAKNNLMKQGFSEAQALERIENEKIMVADAAVRAGKDPVEAVYQEANNIEALIHETASKLGYVKQDKKTNLQKKRELSKPNAMQGGRGTRAVHKGLMDDDNDELDNMSLGDMLKAKKAGTL